MEIDLHDHATPLRARDDVVLGLTVVAEPREIQPIAAPAYGTVRALVAPLAITVVWATACCFFEVIAAAKA